MKELNRQEAKDILENTKFAIHRLVMLEADYEIWQNAKISYTNLKRIKKLLQAVG